MRSPSSRVLTNSVDIYVTVPSQDAEGAPGFTYPSRTRPGVACSVQYQDTGEDADTFGRLTVVNVYHVLFGSDQQLKPRDKLIWTDISPNRTLFVQSNPPSEAGRNSTYVIRAIEKV